MKSIWDRPAPRRPTKVQCPKCKHQVDTEILVGRVRKVTTTVVHINHGKVCHAILKTEENK